MHQRRGGSWQCLTVLKLRWIFNLKAVFVFNWKNIAGLKKKEIVLDKLMRLFFSPKYASVSKISKIASLFLELFFQLKIDASCSSMVFPFVSLYLQNLGGPISSLSHGLRRPCQRALRKSMAM